MENKNRTIHCADALVWLSDQPVLEGCSFITSLPDASEFSEMTLGQWKEWFVRAAGLVLSKCPDDGVVIFYQTDLKKDGVWVDKGFMCQKAAELSGHALIAHKIVCRGEVGNPSFGRPGYSHLLAFSRGVRPAIAQSTADILPKAGQVTWTRGMGSEACKAACRFIQLHTQSHTIVDPFCGHGTVLTIANSMGLHAIGIEIGGNRARKARALSLDALSHSK